jgi:hypothetical protein
MFKGTLSRVCWPCLILITGHNGGSFMSNSGGSAMLGDHTPAAKDKTLPVASVKEASFAGRQ